MLTEKQKERRKSCLGASDIPAILGLDPYKSAYDVWLEKTGRIQDKPENKAMTRGTYLEDALLNWFADSHNKKIIRNQVRSCSQSKTPITATLDALIPEENRPVEAKTVGPYNKESWGEEQTDQVPDRVLIQTTVQMLCIDADLCYVPTYLPYRDFVLFLVPFHQALACLIMTEAERYWEKYVKTDTPPPNTAPSIEIAKCIRKQPNRTVSIPETISRLYRQTAAELKEKEQEHNRAKALLLAALDGAEEGLCSEDGTVYSNRTYERKTLDIERLKKDHPDLAAQYIKENSYSVLRMKEAKERT